MDKKITKLRNEVKELITETRNLIKEVQEFRDNQVLKHENTQSR